jgi:hypothetical protein
MVRSEARAVAQRIASEVEMGLLVRAANNRRIAADRGWLRHRPSRLRARRAEMGGCNRASREPGANRRARQGWEAAPGSLARDRQSLAALASW